MTDDTAAGRIAARLDRIPDSDSLLVEKTDLRAVLAENARLTKELRVERLRSASAERLAGITTQQDADLRAARDMLRRPDQLATGTRMTVREERYDRDGQLVYASEPIAVPDDAPLQFPLAPLHWPGKGSGIPASTTYCGIDRDKHTAHVTVFADEVTCPECTAMIGPLDAEETDSA